jgi:hypothetical protein
MSSFAKSKAGVNNYLATNYKHRNIHITSARDGTLHATFVINNCRFSHNDGYKDTAFLDRWEGCPPAYERPLADGPFKRETTLATDTKHSVKEGCCMLNAVATMRLHTDCVKSELSWDTFLGIMHEITEDELFAYYCGREKRSLTERELKDVSPELRNKLQVWYDRGLKRNPLRKFL